MRTAGNHVGGLQVHIPAWGQRLQRSRRPHVGYEWCLHIEDVSRPQLVGVVSEPLSVVAVLRVQTTLSYAGYQRQSMSITHCDGSNSRWCWDVRRAVVYPRPVVIRPTIHVTALHTHGLIAPITTWFVNHHRSSCVNERVVGK